MQGKSPFFRSEQTSNDYATTAEVLLEVLASYERIGMKFQTVCCIYPTARCDSGCHQDGDDALRAGTGGLRDTSGEVLLPAAEGRCHQGWQDRAEVAREYGEALTGFRAALS